MLNFAATSHQPLIKSNSNFEGLLNLHLTFNKGTFYITLPPTPRCEIPVNIFRKLCFEWWGKREARWGVEGEGSESFFSESFPSQIGTWAFLRRWWREDQEEGEEEKGQECVWENLKGGMWTSHCEIVRMWGENVRSAGFRGTPATDPVGVLIWVSRFVSRIYITIPAWQQWTAVVTILERQKKASIRHNPGSQSGGNYFRRHQVEEEVCLKPWRQARGMP